MAANSFEAKRVLDGGGQCFNYTPASATPAGTVVVVGDLFGIAEVDIAASAEGSLACDGVFACKKATSVVTFSIGDIVAWDVSANLTIAVADVAAGDKTFGKVTKAAVATDATVEVLVIPNIAAVASA